MRTTRKKMCRANVNEQKLSDYINVKQNILSQIFKEGNMREEDIS